MDSAGFVPSGAAERGRNFRVLIVTAMSPYFDAEERESLIGALRHSIEAVRAAYPHADLRIRSSSAVLEALNEGLQLETAPVLRRVLPEYDLVLSTTSTVLLECDRQSVPIVHICFRDYESQLSPFETRVQRAEESSPRSESICYSPEKDWCPLTFRNIPIATRMISWEQRVKSVLKKARRTGVVVQN